MADLQTLMDMGFPKDRAERALQVTNNKGVEPAMEWLLAHADEPLTQEDQTLHLSAAGSGSAVESTPSTANPEATEASATSEDGTPAGEVKSLKCDECGRLFKSQTEVEFHAAKTGHQSFSESTEEKKPLTEEEKKKQMELIDQKIKAKRALREEQEKKEALERERIRIKSGKDMTEARRKMEEMEMQKIVEQRKREKAEEKAARDRVKAQIEADKAARKAKLAGGEIPQDKVQPVQQPSTTTSDVKPNTQKSYSKTRIQIRLQDGSVLTETFDVKEQLAAVRLFVQLKQGNDLPFGMMTTFPRKVFTEEDYDEPLEVLGLVPSAVVTVIKNATG